MSRPTNATPKSSENHETFVIDGTTPGDGRMPTTLQLCSGNQGAQLSRVARFQIACAGRASVTPIMLSRVTSFANCASLQPSVPSGRIGITKYRMSAELS